MKKKAPIAILIRSQAELETQVSEYVRLGSKITAERAKLDIKLARVREEDEPAIIAAETERAAIEQSIAVWAECNKALFLGDARSLDFPTARLGFRTHPHACDKVSAKDTWENIADRLGETPWGSNYVTTPRPKVDKEAILSHRDELTEADLKAVGIRIVQGETFYIDPKLESAAGITIEQAA